MKLLELHSAASDNWNEAENLETEIKTLRRRADSLRELALKGWALAEVDKPVTFSATLASATGTICFPEQTMGLASFLTSVRKNHPTAVTLVLTIQL